MRLFAERALPWGTLAAFGFALVTLVAPAFGNAVWDPYELRSLELARRIALGLFGAEDFALPGTENALPSRGEVDRGELPFTSMALGLELFGLHPFGARLALLAWACVALCSTFLLVRRLSGAGARRSVLLLAATPLFFVHARTLLGDGVTQAALALALGGLTLALYDRGSPALRGAFFLLGCVGLACGGLSRGLLLGVAVPALGPSGAWLVQRLAGGGRADRLTTAFAAALLVAGTAAGAGGAFVLAAAVAEPERYFPLLGFGVVRGNARPTFDALIHALGHGLFPLSALVPVAIGRLLLPPLGSDDGARASEAGLRLAVLFTAALGFGVGGFVADSAGVLPFGPVAALAVLAALALADLDRGAPASPAAGLIVAALLVLFLLDFKNMPEQLLRVFGVHGARFPESFQAPGARFLLAGTALAVPAVVLAFLERDEPEKPIFSADEFLAWPRTLRDLWNGNLLFGACVVEAALLGFFAFDLLGERFVQFERFAAASELTRSLNRVAWLALPVLFLAPFLVLGVRDVLRWLARVRSRGGLGRLVPQRGSLAALGLVGCGTVLGVGYYPGLAAQLSPQEAFDAFRAHARPGDEIGVVGSSAAAGFYAAGRGAAVFETAEEGYDWMVEPGPRRFLVFRSNALAGLNARYRELGEPSRNLPVLSARSSEILLGSQRLAPGERNENPLDRYLLRDLPKLVRPLDANLGGMLDVLGWDVLDTSGRSVASVRPGRRYEFVIYFRVEARVTGSWETFVHIDGFQRRFNVDHATLDGAYPFSLWRTGDLIADRREFVLEPNFGAGEYRVYFGLYSGSRRMPVERGAHSDDRLEAGTLVID